jgi:hypothetical protein
VRLTAAARPGKIGQKFETPFSRKETKRPCFQGLEVDLIDALSHPEINERLKALSAYPRDGFAVSRPPHGQRPTGYASVLDALVAALPEDGALRFVEVHRLVERHVGQPVSKSSVKNALARNSRGESPRFLRVARGRYRRAVPGSSQ